MTDILNTSLPVLNDVAIIHKKGNSITTLNRDRIKFRITTGRRFRLFIVICNLHLNYRDDQNNSEENDTHRGGIAHLIIAESLLINVENQRLGGIQRTAITLAGNIKNLGEYS